MDMSDVHFEHLNGTGHIYFQISDICVVGAGMIGSAAAKHLMKLSPGLNVVLIGPKEQPSQQQLLVNIL
jgi:predicted dinucleotide-binding enzyme